MTDETRDRPSLKTLDPSADRNGQDPGGQDSGGRDPADAGMAARTQAALKRAPDGEAETARLASGTPRQDATDATEAETPPENLARISDASSEPEVGKSVGRSSGAPPAQPDRKAAEAIERATAAVGQPED